MNDPEKLHQRQLHREKKAGDDAKSLLKKRLEDSLLHSKPGFKLVTEYWQPLAKAIEDQQKNILVSKGEWTKPWRFILALGASHLAYYTLTAIIESQRWSESLADPEVDEADPDEQAMEPDPRGEVGDEPQPTAPATFPPDTKGTSVTTVARQIARHCEYHWITCRKDEREAGIARCCEKYPPQIRTQEERKAKAILNASWREANHDVNLGKDLLTLAETLRIIDTGHGRTRKGRKPARIVIFAPYFGREFANYAKLFYDFAPPLRRPMVATPRNWTEKLPGGYLTKDKLGDLPLIKPNIEVPPVSWTGRAQSAQKGLPTCRKHDRTTMRTSVREPSTCCSAADAP